MRELRGIEGKQARNWKAGTQSHPESGKHQPQEEGMRWRKASRANEIQRRQK